jgi:uncharacterized protein YjiS (DUF1127 family)
MGIADAPRLTSRLGAAGAAFARLAGVLRVAVVWRDRARDRHALLRLNDHCLRDIGLTRHDVMIEGEKRFWQP